MQGSKRPYDTLIISSADHFVIGSSESFGLIKNQNTEAHWGI